DDTPDDLLPPCLDMARSRLVAFGRVGTWYPGVPAVPKTMPRSQLDERHRRILKFVVESHVLTTEPVGSQYVRVAYHLSISPATIRGAMKRLEEEGLLDHPHTSAGRVPTEPG